MIETKVVESPELQNARHLLAQAEQSIARNVRRRDGLNMRIYDQCSYRDGLRRAIEAMEKQGGI